MKRAAKKVKKFNQGGDAVYDKEDEGMFGGKIKYREDDQGRKYVAGTPNAYDRNPAEKRYYSMSDIKSKLGMGENKPPKSDIESQLDRANSMPDVKESPKGIASNWKSDQEVFKRADNEVQLPAASVSKTKTTVTRKLPSNKNAPSYSGVVSSKDLGSQSFSVKGSSIGSVSGAAPKSKYSQMMEDLDKDIRDPSAWENMLPAAGGARVLKALPQLAKEAAARSTAKATQKLAAQNAREALKEKALAGTREGIKRKEQMLDDIRMGSDYMKKGGRVKKMASGGKVRTASQRADGCAIRGKTRA